MRRRDFLKTSVMASAMMTFGRDLFAAALTAGNTPKTLVLGGGAFACGLACAHSDQILILERGIHLAADYALTFDPVEVGTPTTKIGQDLLQALQNEGLVTDGKLEHPPVADFISVFCAQRGVKAFMRAELADLQKKEGGYSAMIYGNPTEGFSTFDISNLLDTTDLSWKNLGADAIKSKRICASTDNGIFKVDLPADADWKAARLQLYTAWEQAGNPKNKFPLAEAGAIRCFYEGKISRTMPLGYKWVPSGQFSTLIEAFEEGYKWNLD